VAGREWVVNLFDRGAKGCVACGFGLFYGRCCLEVVQEGSRCTGNWNEVDVKRKGRGENAIVTPRKIRGLLLFSFILMVQAPVTLIR
jgi:hypothetical protein